MPEINLKKKKKNLKNRQKHSNEVLPRYFLPFDLEIGVQTQVNSAVHPHLFEKLSGGDRVKIFNLKVYIYTHTKAYFKRTLVLFPFEIF